MTTHTHHASPLDNILARLQGVKRQRNGYLARCPAHADRKPSLSVTEKDGRVLLHCHAGCRAEEVTRALGLELRDLFTQPPASSFSRKPTERVVAAYEYHDAAGAVRYQVVRLEPKGFRQRRPNGNGGWIWNLQGVEPLLYRLPWVRSAAAHGGQVFIVEGEKDVCALKTGGLIATCNSGGAGKWQPGFADELRGAQVVILPDNDAPGRAHALEVAESLYGKAASVKIFALPDLPEKGDVSDWLADGHTCRQLIDLAEDAPAWTPGKHVPAGFPPTDLGNAERLVAAHGHELRYNVSAEAWLRWTGQTWQQDETGDIHRLAAGVVRGIGAEAEQLPGKEERRELFRHALRSESEGRLGAMIHLARYREGIPVAATDLDWAAHLLAVNNGTLDLRTGRLHPHDPADLITKLAPVTYDKEATCPRWEQFLREVFLDDAALIAYVQRLAGYLLTGETSEQAVFLLVGKGANGKSVLVETLRSLLGDYAKDTPFSTFLERRETNTADLAALVGARMVTASEGEGQQSFNESLLKRLSGGDPVTCRYLYKAFFSYTPTYKVLIATNEVPRLHAQNLAMRRRVKLLPFRQTFYAPEDGKTPLRDDTLRGKLRLELSGILNWALRGCLQWQDNGLQPPPIVLEGTNDLFQSFDPLADFLDEKCMRGPQEQIEVGTLWKVYVDWCETNERQPAFKQVQWFSHNLTQRDGIEMKRQHGGRKLTGLGLQRVES
ncbi:MAG: phage/plasmid primase, P4 family [Armatimonadota bacterium]